ncbi:MAG: hypothetical protein E6J88_14600 [Deltaproteobacteria bacterium]|nr:MAG: hypothetical protein E6J88_14600 [Deltaproteobacteria bacterium]
MKTRIAILLALAAAGCKIKGNPSLLITKVISGTLTAATTSAPALCTFDPGSTEIDFLPYNPVENTGNVGAVVSNTILPTTAVNPTLRTDAATFLPHQAVVDYEVIGGGASIGEKIVPAAGAEVPSGTSAPVLMHLLPAGTLPAGLAAGTIIRTTFHVEGKLVDGSTVHTSEREFLFEICTSTGCGSPCL